MLDLEIIVFSRIKNRFSAELIRKFPNAYFTTSDRAVAQPRFPTIYIHEMSGREMGQDLAGTEINAVLSTFQIEVFDNMSESNVSEVMANIVNTMKSMRFDVISMPEFRNDNDVYRKVARFRRVIGSADIL